MPAPKVAAKTAVSSAAAEEARAEEAFVRNVCRQAQQAVNENPRIRPRVFIHREGLMDIVLEQGLEPYVDPNIPVAAVWRSVFVK
jgi:hypothetical protein